MSSVFVCVPLRVFAEDDDYGGHYVTTDAKPVVCDTECGVKEHALNLWRTDNCDCVVVVSVDESHNVYMYGMVGWRRSGTKFDLMGDATQCIVTFTEIAICARQAVSDTGILRSED